MNAGCYAAPQQSLNRDRAEISAAGSLPILILAPLRNDARFTADFLTEANLLPVICSDARQLCAQAGPTCGAILLAEEALDKESIPLLNEVLLTQPKWSDLPVAIITSSGEGTLDRRDRLAAFGRRANVVLIERPFQSATLVSTLQVALRSRQRQLQVRELLKQTQADAAVLRSSEERYRRLAAQSARQARIYEATLASTVDLLYVFDLDGRFIYTNSRLPAILGKTAEELLGKDFHQLDYPPELAKKLSRQIQEVIQTKKPLRDETPFTGAAGEHIYEYILAPVFAGDESVEAVAGVTRDITTRRSEEEVVRASRDQFQEMADSAPAMLWITEPNGYCTFLSRSWYMFTGQTLAEGHGLGWTNAIHPDEKEAAGQEFIKASERREFYLMDFRLRRADGEYRWVVDAGQPRFGADGEFLGYIGSVIDIHERKTAEAALEERATALRDADRRKDEFLAMLAHELRNPLSSVANAISLMKDRENTDDHSWATDVIDRQTRQLARLVDDLLDVSRITRGKIELRRELLDAASCLESACEAVAPLIAERHHTLEASIPHGELWLDADPTRLEQIFVNLLANAAKYTRPHGMIWLEAQREGGEIVVNIRDNGDGIAPEKIPAMFELFSQGERSVARSEGGLGIGLTVVRGLCVLHDGTVSAHSAGRGAGSTFTVRLPAASQPGRAQIDHGEQSREPKGAGLRVLVVDDNVDAAAGLARLLARRGYAVELAHDGQAALKAAHAYSPTAVLLDIGLPGMDGYEVARHLRADPCCYGALIVALTGYGQDEDRRLSQEAGFDHHLVKPVDFATVQALLADCAVRIK